MVVITLKALKAMEWDVMFDAERKIPIAKGWKVCSWKILVRPLYITEEEEVEVWENLWENLEEEDGVVERDGWTCRVVKKRPCTV